MSNSLVERTLKDVQHILWSNLPPTDSLTDEAAVKALRQIVRSPDVKLALERGSDTASVFVLRAINTVLADDSALPGDIITSLWPILDQLEVDRISANPQRSRIRIGPRKPPPSF
jgi:hypothetical protein